MVGRSENHEGGGRREEGGGREKGGVIESGDWKKKDALPCLACLACRCLKRQCLSMAVPGKASHN